MIQIIELTRTRTYRFYKCHNMYTNMEGPLEFLRWIVFVCFDQKKQFGLVMFFHKLQLWNTFFKVCEGDRIQETNIFFDILSDLSFPKANTLCTYVVQLHRRNNFFVHSAITEACAIIKLSYSLVLLQNGEWSINLTGTHKCVIFLLTKDSISVQPYSVDEFLHVEMTSHQQGEDVPLFKRHGAEGLQDSLICLFQVPRCCGVAVTQVDQPGQDLFKKHLERMGIINTGNRSTSIKH